MLKNRIAYYMEKRRVTPEELAEQVGMTAAAVRYWMRNQSNPKGVQRQLQVARALKVKYNSLFYIDKTITPNDLP